MKAAMLRAARGDRAKLPHRAMVHVIAARYGQDPEDVADWPADTFLDAVNFLPATGASHGR